MGNLRPFDPRPGFTNLRINLLSRDQRLAQFRIVFYADDGKIWRTLHRPKKEGVFYAFVKIAGRKIRVDEDRLEGFFPDKKRLYAHVHRFGERLGHAALLQLGEDFLAAIRRNKVNTAARLKKLDEDLGEIK
jgi:hypothetical protein